MEIDEILRRRNRFIKTKIPLQPSENYICKGARKALASDFQTRYSLKINNFHGLEIDNAYAGASLSEILIEEVTKKASKYFNAEFVDVRPISGHIAAMQVLGNLLNKGDNFLYVGIENGGYDGYQEQYLQELLGLHGIKFPFKGWNIDYEKLMNYKKNIRALILGASIIFEPYDLKVLKEIFPDSLILYDASHVLSLFSTDTFQRDRELIDVIYGSTHKNFPGPQGGIIFGKREFEDKIKGDVIWKYYDNFHIGRIASLGFSLDFAKKINYAETCLDNTREFISSAMKAKIKMMNIPTVSKTCMIQLNYPNNSELSILLERKGILIDRIGRIGLNEVTSLGLKPHDVSKIPKIMKDILDGKSPDKEIKEILKEFIRR